MFLPGIYTAAAAVHSRSEPSAFVAPAPAVLSGGLTVSSSTAQAGGLPDVRAQRQGTSTTDSSAGKIFLVDYVIELMWLQDCIITYEVVQ